MCRGNQETVGTMKQSRLMKPSYPYYVFILLVVYYSSGQIINRNHNRLMGILPVLRCIFPPNLEILPSSQCKWNSHAYPANIATLAQRRHWSASSRSAADVAPTLVFRRLHCYGMSAFRRSATVGISLCLPMFCVCTSVVGNQVFLE